MTSSRTETDVVNLALREIGTYRISDLRTEDSADAEVARDVYDETVLECLAGHEWRFAIKQAALQQGTITPSARYDYAYDLPSDFVRLSSVSESDDMLVPLLDFDVIDSPNTPGVQAIIANVGSVYIEYVYERTEPARWPPWFVAFVVARLASRLASPLKSTVERERLEQLADERMRKARSADGTQQPPKRPPTGDWIAAMKTGRRPYWR